MLTIYEQIQSSVDYAEAHLGGDVTAEAAAATAAMSLRSFHRYFVALTGYRFGEYVRERRVSSAMRDVVGSDASILEIALGCGYDSHEAFTRAFRNEFGAPPSRFRAGGRSAPRTERIDLMGDVHMGVLTRSLPEMTVVCFDGFKPDPEDKAAAKMQAWMGRHPEALGSHRVFGHNIDRQGRLAHDPDNEGYEVQVTVPQAMAGDEERMDVIEAGRFVVTGIEGSFEDDPTGSWITDGWRRLQVMVEQQRYEIHHSHRWFEEWLEPTEPGRTRFDLYLEIV